MPTHTTLLWRAKVVFRRSTLAKKGILLQVLRKQQKEKEREAGRGRCGSNVSRSSVYPSPRRTRNDCNFTPADSPGQRVVLLRLLGTSECTRPKLQGVHYIALHYMVYCSHGLSSAACRQKTSHQSVRAKPEALSLT